MVQVVLLSSAGESSRAYLNEWRQSAHSPFLAVHADVEQATCRLQYPRRSAARLPPHSASFTVTLQPGGHVLGSAVVPVSEIRRLEPGHGAYTLQVLLLLALCSRRRTATVCM